jgi:hypothetical protein
VFIDEIDVTHVVVEGSSTRRLNRPSEAQIRIPMTDAIGGVGSLLKIYFTTDLDSVPWLHFHGRVLVCETSAGEDGGYTVYNATDPLELWKWRPVRDSTGNLILPGTHEAPPIHEGVDADLASLAGTSSAVTPNSTPDAVSMIEAMYDNTVFVAPGPPSKCDGPLFLQKGSVTTGSNPAKGAPTDWPMTMSQLTALLISTGDVDVVITPIELTPMDPTPGYTCSGQTIYDHARMDLYPGNYGTDLTTSVAFQYGMGLHNVRALRWNEDMSNLTNKLVYELGPKCDAQHFQANIVGTAGQEFPITAVDTGAGKFTVTGDATGLANGSTIIVSGSTGNDGNYTVVSTVFSDPDSDVEVLEPIFDSTADGVLYSDFWTSCAPDWQTSHQKVTACAGTGIGSCSPLDSRGEFGVRMDTRIFDGLGDGCANAAAPLVYCLYKRNWLRESWLRCVPRTLVHVTPTRDTGIGEFDIGDTVLVEAAPEVRGGFSGAQRIYEYTISWDATDSVPSIGELQVSSDNAGFDS